MSYERVNETPMVVMASVPAASVPVQEQEFVLVTPPNPSAEEFKATIMNRHVEFNISKYVQEGWVFVKYNFCSFFAIGLLLIGVSIGLDVAQYFAVGGHHWHRIDQDGQDEYYYEYDWSTRTIVVTIAFVLFKSALFVPVFASMYQAVFNAMRTNTKLKFGDFFSCFNCAQWPRLMLLWLLMTVCWAGAFVFWPLLFVVFYMWLSSVFAVPLLVEQSFMSIFNSMYFSFKVFHRYFCSFLGFLLLLGVLQLLGALCFIVGLFVSLPVAFVAMCYCYHHLIGVNGVAVLVPTSHLEGMPAPSPAPMEVPVSAPVAV